MEKIQISVGICLGEGGMSISRNDEEIATLFRESETTMPYVSQSC